MGLERAGGGCGGWLWVFEKMGLHHCQFSYAIRKNVLPIICSNKRLVPKNMNNNNFQIL